MDWSYALTLAGPMVAAFLLGYVAGVAKERARGRKRTFYHANPVIETVVCKPGQLVSVGTYRPIGGRVRDPDEAARLGIGGPAGAIPR